MTLRVLFFIALTGGLTAFILFVLLVLGLAFGSPLPECTDSDTCDWWGDFLYNTFPGTVVCLLFGAVIAWGIVRAIR